MNTARPLSSSSGRRTAAPLILSASPATGNRLLLSDVCEATPSRSRYLTVSEHRERLQRNSMVLLYPVTSTETSESDLLLYRTTGGGVTVNVAGRPPGPPVRSGPVSAQLWRKQFLAAKTSVNTGRSDSVYVGCVRLTPDSSVYPS